VVGNSQISNNTDNGIFVGSGSDFNNIQGNLVGGRDWCEQALLWLVIGSSDCESNLVVNNDLYSAGVTEDNYDIGSGTIFRNNWLTTGWAVGCG
jgi:hypothetical protein